MNDDPLLLEFVGGSQDGLVIEAKSAPDYAEIMKGDDVKEVYKRDNDEPPFFYVKVGDEGNEAGESFDSETG